jgi:hypothetical protein
MLDRAPFARRPAAEPQEGPRRFRAHLGAHKTATKHIQRRLEGHASRLAEQGDLYLGGWSGVFNARPRYQRRLDAPLLRRHSGLGERLIDAAPLAPSAGRLQTLRAALRDASRDVDTVVFSEENILGPISHALVSPLYPNLRQIAVLRTLTAGAETDLFLSIRSIDRVLPGAYATALRFRAFRRSDFEAVRRRALARPPSWIRLIDRIQRAFPAARLHVWSYDDYARNSHRICELIAGRPLPETPEPPRPTKTRTPSARAIEAAEALTVRGAARFGAVGAIYEEDMAAGDFEPFNPLDPAERARLRAFFERELEEIARRRPGVLTRFD